MSLSEKVKTAFEWFGHGKDLVETAVWVLAALGGGAVVRAWLLRHMSDAWITPVWLLSSAILLWILLRFGPRLVKTKEVGQSSGTQSNAPALSVATKAFDATEFFRHAYYSPLQPQIEANVRSGALENQPTDKEGFYVKLIAMGLISFNYDLIWAYIFKSQLLALLQLNRNSGFLPLADFKAYYDQAALAAPAAYAQYSFDQWFLFMQNQTLVIKHPSNMVEITAGGKDFLKYLLHWGRDPDQRAL